MFLWVAVITVLVPAYYSAFCTLCRLSRLSRPRFRPKGLCSLQCAIECPHEAQQKTAPLTDAWTLLDFTPTKVLDCPLPLGQRPQRTFSRFISLNRPLELSKCDPMKHRPGAGCALLERRRRGRGYEKGRKDGKMDRRVYSTVQYGICRCAFFSVAVNRYRVDMWTCDERDRENSIACSSV